MHPLDIAFLGLILVVASYLVFMILRHRTHQRQREQATLLALEEMRERTRMKKEQADSQNPQ
jgi:hypothetical protein